MECTKISVKLQLESVDNILNILSNKGCLYSENHLKKYIESQLKREKKGIKVEKKITDKQINNIANAYKNDGTDSINGFKKILLN